MQGRIIVLTKEVNPAVQIFVTIDDNNIIEKIETSTDAEAYDMGFKYDIGERLYNIDVWANLNGWVMGAGNYAKGGKLHKKGDFIKYRVWFPASQMVADSKGSMSETIYSGKIDKVTHNRITKDPIYIVNYQEVLPEWVIEDKAKDGYTVLTPEDKEKMIMDTYRLDEAEWMKKYPIGDFGDYKTRAEKQYNVDSYTFAKGGYSRDSRPSPSDSATEYNGGFEMEGNDGNIWKVSVTDKGVHRWVKTTKTKADEINEKLKPLAKIFEEKKERFIPAETQEEEIPTETKVDLKPRKEWMLKETDEKWDRINKVVIPAKQKEEVTEEIQQTEEIKKPKMESASTPTVIEKLKANGFINDDLSLTNKGNRIVELHKFCFPMEAHPFSHIYYEAKDIYPSDKISYVIINTETLYTNGTNVFEVGKVLQSNLRDNAKHDTDLQTKLTNTLTKNNVAYLPYSYCPGVSVKATGIETSPGFMVFHNLVNNVEVYVNSMVYNYIVKNNNVEAWEADKDNPEIVRALNSNGTVAYIRASDSAIGLYASFGLFDKDKLFSGLKTRYAKAFMQGISYQEFIKRAELMPEPIAILPEDIEETIKGLELMVELSDGDERAMYVTEIKKLKPDYEIPIETMEAGGLKSIHDHDVIAYKDGNRATYFVDKKGDGYTIIRHTGSVLMPFEFNTDKNWEKVFKENFDSYEVEMATGGGVEDGFKEWFEANTQSEGLKNDYRQYEFILQQEGNEQPKTFRQWAKEYWMGLSKMETGGVTKHRAPEWSPI